MPRWFTERAPRCRAVGNQNNPTRRLAETSNSTQNQVWDPAVLGRKNQRKQHGLASLPDALSVSPIRPACSCLHRCRDGNGSIRVPVCCVAVSGRQAPDICMAVSEIHKHACTRRLSCVLPKMIPAACMHARGDYSCCVFAHAVSVSGCLSCFMWHLSHAHVLMMLMMTLVTPNIGLV
jgi:hypothetical protein